MYEVKSIIELIDKNSVRISNEKEQMREWNYGMRIIRLLLKLKM